MQIISLNHAKNIGEQIRLKRKMLNMTQKEFANLLGKQSNGERTIRRWESGITLPNKIELEYILNYNVSFPFFNLNTAKYSMIDLFSGIGGTRLGFHLTKQVKSVFSSEIDKYAIKTYFSNFGDIPAGDISKINAKDIPDHDILVGGFPCQSFSQAGKKLGFDDTRGTLFFEIARIIQEKHPKAFLLENVKNLVNHDNGKTFKIILKVLKELNYEVFYTLFKARDFGVSQNRERIYIVGFNKNKIQNFELFNFPRKINKKTCVADILEKNVDDKYTISDKLWLGHQNRKIKNKANNKGFGYSLFNEKSEYTNTISARYYKDGSEILIEQNNKNPRKLTPREAARLQGFPEEFIIPVSDTQAYKQFGNSVAVPVINKIAEQIIKILDKN